MVAILDVISTEFLEITSFLLRKAKYTLKVNHKGSKSFRNCVGLKDAIFLSGGLKILGGKKWQKHSLVKQN